MIEEHDLTPTQREVVEARDRLIVALGGAGSGKTTTALWAAHAELKRAHPRARALFLTFSRTAVEQISSRSRSASESLSERLEISTFHALAFRLIRSFGRYAGRGVTPPDIQSPAQIRLVGRQEGVLSYDDLIPQALETLRSARLLTILSARWPLIICDEFQDTSEDQWQLLNLFRRQSRLLLLADPNQMIYSFLPGVGPQRLHNALTLADLIVRFEPTSHRDPSHAIPALAEAVLQRAFQADPVHNALRSGRLAVRTSVDDDALIDVISAELRAAWSAGARDFGIFGHSNEGVASLGHSLTQAGIEHELVGLPDAQAEALTAMATMCRFAMGDITREALHVALATFLTACSRGHQAPDLAVALATDGPIPRTLDARIQTLSAALLEAAPSTVAVAAVLTDAWSSLGIVPGIGPWARAVHVFAPFLRRATRKGTLDLNVMMLIERGAKELRSSALLDPSQSRISPTQLMNFHQTKGREADAVILVYRDRDVLAGWQDEEPFEESSRVLYVALTRARQRVSVILPHDPHPLVAPFAAISSDSF